MRVSGGLWWVLVWLVTLNFGVLCWALLRQATPSTACLPSTARARAPATARREPRVLARQLVSRTDARRKATAPVGIVKRTRGRGGPSKAVATVATADLLDRALTP